KGGSRHQFRFRAHAGHLVQLTVEQKGSDVTVVVMGPDGKLVAEVDSPLEIKLLDRNAPIGRYLVTLETPRKAIPEDRKFLDELFWLRSQISVFTLRGPGKDTSQHYLATLKALNEQAEQLEAQISTRSVEFKVQTTPMTLESIQKLIPTNAALVEFALYHPYDPKTNKFNPPHYAVYVLKNQGSGPGKQGSGFRVQWLIQRKIRFNLQIRGNNIKEMKRKTRNPEPGTRNPVFQTRNPEPCSGPTWGKSVQLNLSSRLFDRSFSQLPPILGGDLC
ncbi:MAG TPA: hypothetical protein PLB18_24555, partial [Acidobacteriota bacterium]|nr:hypothetical protein [Acidobacteriota bacterium]